MRPQTSCLIISPPYDWQASPYLLKPRRASIKFSEEEVLDIEMDNKPGAFAEFAGRLARAGINIRYAYATTTSFGRARVIVSVRYVSRALTALGESTTHG